jgi:hypothetical protein
MSNLEPIGSVSGDVTIPNIGHVTFVIANSDEKTPCAPTFDSSSVSILSLHSHSLSLISSTCASVSAPLCRNTACKNYTGAPCGFCELCSHCHNCAFPLHEISRVRATYFPPKHFADIGRRRSRPKALVLDVEKLKLDILRCESDPKLQCELRLLLKTKSLAICLPTPSYARNAKQPMQTSVIDQSAYGFVLPQSTEYQTSPTLTQTASVPTTAPSSPSRRFRILPSSPPITTPIAAMCVDVPSATCTVTSATTTTTSTTTIAKASAPTISEHWDLALVDSLLSAPHLLSVNDLRVLRDVKANATKEGLYVLQYAFADGADFGRVNTGGKGYQAISRQMRALCSSRFYVEDDMVNSFPVIMNQVFKRNGLFTPFLTSYIEDRDLLLRDHASPTLPRDAVKKLFLISLHLGDYMCHNDYVPIHFLSRFQNEIKSNAKCLLKTPDYASLHSLAVSLKRRNPLGTMISWICQRAESEIMQAKTEFTERFFHVATNLF